MTEEINRLKWLCRRGTKELDFVLNRYLERHYENADDEEKAAFNQLLELEDPILNDKLLNVSSATSNSEKNIINKLLGSS